MRGLAGSGRYKAEHLLIKVYIKVNKHIMVTIRLSRGGAKRRPFYTIVVTDSRSARDGRYIERLGFFNPVATGGEERLVVNRERIEYWLSHGAKASDRVGKLLKDAA